MDQDGHEHRPHRAEQVGEEAWRARREERPSRARVDIETGERAVDLASHTISVGGADAFELVLDVREMSGRRRSQEVRHVAVHWEQRSKRSEVVVALELDEHVAALGEPAKVRALRRGDAERARRLEHLRERREGEPAVQGRVDREDEGDHRAPSFDDESLAAQGSRIDSPRG